MHSYVVVLGTLVHRYTMGNHGYHPRGHGGGVHRYTMGVLWASSEGSGPDPGLSVSAAASFSAYAAPKQWCRGSWNWFSFFVDPELLRHRCLGPARCCPPRHPTDLKPLFLELNGIV